MASMDANVMECPVCIQTRAGLQADNEAAISNSLQEGCRRRWKRSSEKGYYSFEDRDAGLNLHFRVPAQRCSTTYLQDNLWPESLIFCRHTVLSASASGSDFKLVRRVADDPYIAQRSEP